MPKPNDYTYTAEGTAAGGQTWKTSGTIHCDFFNTLFHATRDSFDQLTQGKAVYGQPGVGCQGPYDVTRIVIERVKQ